MPKGHISHFHTWILIMVTSKLWHALVTEKAPPFLPSPPKSKKIHSGFLKSIYISVFILKIEADGFPCAVVSSEQVPLV